MMFEVGRCYYDAVGRKWRIVRRRTIDEGTVVYIVSHRYKVQIAVEDTPDRATVFLDDGFTTIYAGERGMTDNSVHATNHTDNCENHEKRNYDTIHLKQCPFCGEQVTLHAPRPNELNYSPYIRCGCHAEIWGASTEDVIERWNRRVIE